MEAITSVADAIELYSKVLDKEVPWKDFKDLPKELQHYTSDYSKESAHLVGRVRTQLANATDEYFATSQAIREMCDGINSFADLYVEGIDDANPTVNGEVFSAILETAVDKMKEAQKPLTETSNHFCSLSGLWIVFLARLEHDFTENSVYFQKQVQMKENAAGGSWFSSKESIRQKIVADLKQHWTIVKRVHSDLKAKIDEANIVIWDTKFKIDKQIPLIAAQKANIDKSYASFQLNPQSRQAIKRAVKDVTDQCNAYMQSH